jgi:hypothetical protein
VTPFRIREGEWVLRAMLREAGVDLDGSPAADEVWKVSSASLRCRRMRRDRIPTGSCTSKGRCSANPSSKHDRRSRPVAAKTEPAKATE